jgi:1,4-alpha-glucan branching enzyme
MHDTLQYLSREPVHRRWHHDRMTFGLVYCVQREFHPARSRTTRWCHGKRSLLGRIHGDAWQQFATLRAFYAAMWAHPGKKLLFMGQEFAQGREWNFDAGLDWPLLSIDWHRGVQALVRDCNRGYRGERALHARDCEGRRLPLARRRRLPPNSVFAWLRPRPDARPVAVVVNFTPVPRAAYRIGLPEPGRWREILNTDGAAYGGSNSGNAEASMRRGRVGRLPCHADLMLPPLGTLWLAHEGSA